MNLVGAATCCGAVEVSGVHNTTPENFIKNIAFDSHTGKRISQPIVTWYDNSRGRGYRIARYIKENELGEIVQTKLVSNKGSRIRGFMWVLPEDLEERAKKLGIKPPKPNPFSRPQDEEIDF